MAKRILTFLLIFAFVGALAGCETVREHKGAAVGAGAGAATGAIAGGVIGKSTGAAVVGGLLGGLAGGAIGHYAYDEKRDRRQTASAYPRPSQGTFVRVEDVSVSPTTVRPGDQVDLRTTYAVLTASPGAETSITEIRELTHNGVLVGKPEVRITRTDGTYTSSVPIRLPANAARGTYDVRVTVQSADARDTRSTQFTVS